MLKLMLHPYWQQLSTSNTCTLCMPASMLIISRTGIPLYRGDNAASNPSTFTCTVWLHTLLLNNSHLILVNILNGIQRGVKCNNTHFATKKMHTFWHRIGCNPDLTNFTFLLPWE